MAPDSDSDIASDKRGSTGVARQTTTTTQFEGNLALERSKIYDKNSLRSSLLAESVSLSEAAVNNSIGIGFDLGVPKGCQFSPDGTCLLTARANLLELYNTPYEKEEQSEDEDENRNSSSCNVATGRWKPVIKCNSGESVRSYAWYPHMKSSDPASCCFLGVSRDSPVHLYDAYDGSIRATYSPYNALDEMESPTTLCFAENGRKLVTGGLRSDRIMHVFDINRPGRDHTPPLLKLGKTRRSKDGQKGLISAMAYSERNGVIAVGTYSPGSIYLYDMRTYSMGAVAEIVMSSSASTSSGGTVCLAGHGKKGRKSKRKRFMTDDDDVSTSCNVTSDDDGTTTKDSGDGDNPSSLHSTMNFSAAKLQWYQSRTRQGVTQVEFENDDGNGVGGQYLFSTSRRSNAILQWDLRKLSTSNFCPGIASFETNNETNQRIEFRVRGDQLWTGGIDGCVRVYSHRRPVGTKSTLLTKISGFRDCVNGISLHPDAILGSHRSEARLEQLRVPSPNEIKDDGNDDTGCINSNVDDMATSLLAVAVGRRHFPSESDWEDDNPHKSMLKRKKPIVSSIQVYSLPKM